MLKEIIQQQHLDLRELFMQHQEQLLQGEFQIALDQLQQFKHYLQIHMQLEEQHVFPEFTNIERKSRWELSLYEQEHEKINTHYNRLVNDLTGLLKQKLNESQTRRNIIALLDREKTFKGMLEHHEEREEDAMLTELDEQLEPAKLEKLVDIIKATWTDATTNLKK